jgi:hypothetical protein
MQTGYTELPYLRRDLARKSAVLGLRRAPIIGVRSRERTFSTNGSGSTCGSERVPQPRSVRLRGNSMRLRITSDCIFAGHFSKLQ